MSTHRDRSNALRARGRHPRTRIALTTLVACAACSTYAPSSDTPPLSPTLRVVDLTHTFDASTIYWPTEAGFEHLHGTAGPTQAGHYYEAHAFRAAEHGGTHVDAPVHFHEGGAHVEALELARLLAPGVVVDVAARCARDRDHRVSLADLREHERLHGPIPQRAIVLLRTGFAAHWPDRARYLGTALRGEAGVGALHFPGLSADAAAWLADERDVAAVGIDTASIDHGPSRRFEAHVALASRGVPVFENVASLDALPVEGFWVVALPMKIGGGSGAPLRIVALLP